MVGWMHTLDLNLYTLKMEKVDVLICGSGSAGLCAATWLAKYGVRCKVLERRGGPMKMGQADGVQCRTVEIFESFGIGEELLREAYHVLEVNFWADDGAGSIKRTGRTADTQPGLSHQPHLILNQARINGLLIELMQKYNNQQIDYGYNVTDVKVDSASVGDHDAYPVKVTAEKDGKIEMFAAKYALVRVTYSSRVGTFMVTDFDPPGL
jgi:phenol 2-monooxygenase